MSNSITDLYLKDPYVYAAIADDRDFKEQLNHLVAQISKQRHYKLKSLELFAGPAVHSITLSEQFEADTYCIDNSPAMREVAIAADQQSRLVYLVEELPSIPPSVTAQRFDLILILRFSLGYLGRNEMADLMKQIRKLLAPGGLVCIELHCRSLLAEELESLPIRLRRKLSLLDGKETMITCAWPADRLRWNSKKTKASMPVVIKQQLSTGQTREFTYISEETIYTVQEVIEYFPTSEFQHTVLNNKFPFPGATTLCIQKK